MNQLISKKYNNIVSVGCMCSTALYLRKIGVRSKSCFFDWVNIKCFEDVIKIMNDNFADCLNINFLKQNFPDSPHIVTNTKYNIDFVHLFNSKLTFKKQFKSVNDKVKRSIKNLKDSLSDSCLLIYYARAKDDIIWIQTHQKNIKSFSEKYNCDLYFVFNFECTQKFDFKNIVIPQNNIHKPFGGGVSFPFTETKDLDDFLISHFDKDKRSKNLKFKEKKSIFVRIRNLIFRIRKNKLIVGEKYE